MTLPAVQEDWNLSAIGLKLTNPDLPFKAFSDLCWQLGRFHEAVRFAIGDAILIGEKMYGEEAFQAFENLNISEEGMREYARVSHRVPRSRRVRNLSWSHHRAVASLDPPDQKEWLKKASEEGMSHHEMRDALRNGAEPKAQTSCRCCGRTFD